MSLNLQCPHCQHIHDDPWEVLDADRIDEMRCESCGRTFSFALMECHHCAEEGVHTWPHAPAHNALDLLTCESCGSTYRIHEPLDSQADAQG